MFIGSNRYSVIVSKNYNFEILYLFNIMSNLQCVRTKVRLNAVLKYSLILRSIML